MKIMFPDYNECIVNLSNSIMKYFGLANYHSTLKEVDEVLDKKHPKNVVVILCDGMGSNILKRDLKEDSFLVKNLKRSITSVAPATTTASTTAMISGLYPCEHGWVGWNTYVKPEDKIVTLYLNCLKDTEISAAEYHVGYKHFKYDSIIDRINNETEFNSVQYYPFGENQYKDFDDLCDKILKESCKEGKRFIYGYSTEPDSLMHDYGVDSEKAKNCIGELNNKIESLVERLEDTVAIIVADHGQVNCENIFISQYLDFYNTLDGDISIEGRTCSFKVKKDKEKEFKNLFEKYFSSDFLLKKKHEVIEESLFGFGKHHKYFSDSIGDYVALGVTNKLFLYNEKAQQLVGNHAGYTEDEMLIPLIIIEK